MMTLRMKNQAKNEEPRASILRFLVCKLFIKSKDQSARSITIRSKNRKFGQEPAEIPYDRRQMIRETILRF